MFASAHRLIDRLIGWAWAAFIANTYIQTVEGEEEPAFHYCAVLRTCADGHFKLFLNGCEACDKRVDKYTCGGAAGCTADRQLLAEVFHVSCRGVHKHSHR